MHFSDKLKTIFSKEKVDEQYLVQEIRPWLGELVIFSNDNRIEGILIENIKSKGLIDSLDINEINSLKEKSKSRLIKTMSLISMGLEVCEVFNNRKIRYRCLKGFYLTNSIYKSNELRPINDIDILVHSEDMTKAIETLKEIQFKSEFPSKNPILFDKDRYELRMIRDNPNLRLEIHSKVFLKNQEINKYFWGKGEVERIKGTKVIFPPIEILLMHILYHGTSKNNFDVGIQYLFDIQELVHKKNLNWSELEELSIKLKLNKEFILTVSLIQKIFGLNINLKQTSHKELKKEIIDSAENILFSPVISESIAKLFYNEYRSNRISLRKLLKLSIKIKNKSNIKSHVKTLLKLIYSKELKFLIVNKKRINRFFENNVKNQ